MRKPKIPLILVITILVSAVGCTSDAGTATQTSTLHPVPSLILPTATQTIPSTPTPTQTPTITPTFTLTPTLFPTLSWQQKNAVFVELLKPTAQCSLPCWWGIHPGKTTWQAAQDYLSSNKIDTEYYAPAYYTGATDPHGVGYSFLFFERDKLVKMIQVRSQSESSPESFRKFWADYSPEAIIATYGRPSRIWLESSNTISEGNPTSMGFHIWFFYDQLGFFINYDGAVAYQPTYRFCPTFDYYGSDINRLNMFLISPDSGTSLSDLTQYSPIAYMPLDLEQASGLTIDEFYALYQQKSKPICIDTPRDVWK